MCVVKSKICIRSLEGNAYVASVLLRSRGSLLYPFLIRLVV